MRVRRKKSLTNMGIYYCLGKRGESDKRWDTGQEASVHGAPLGYKIATKAGRCVPQVCPTVYLSHR